MRLDTQLDSLPEPIAAALRKSLRRARRVILVRGVCAVLAVAVGAALLAMGIDVCVLLVSPAARWLVSSFVYASSISAAYLFLVRPLACSFTLAGVARMIDSHHPEMQERLSSVVELLTTTDAPGVRGSQELIDRLTAAAAADAQGISPRSEVSARAALPYVAAASFVGAVLAAAFLVSPQKTGFLLARAAAPLANLPNISALDLRVKPGDVVVPRGERLEIEAMSLKSDVRSATIERFAGKGPKITDEMRRTPAASGDKARQFSFVIPAVERDFTYRIQADDALTKYYRVTAVTPPAIERIDLRIDFPEYTHMPPCVEEASNGAITALAGSTATLSVKVSKPLVSAELRMDTPALISLSAETDSSRGDNSLVFRLPLTPGLSGIYSIKLTDEHGLGNAKFERTAQALPDTPPVVLITDLPRKEIRLKRDDRFPVYFIATDDIGLKSVELLLEKDAVTLPPRAVNLPAASGDENGAPRKFEGCVVIDLADPELRGAGRLTFQIAACDILPEALKGPQKGLSEVYTIVFDDNAQSYKSQALRSQHEAAKNMLQQARRELEESKSKVPHVKEVAQKKEKKPEQLAERIDALREKIATGDAVLRGLSEKLSDGYFDDMARKIDELREKQLIKAQGLADQVVLAENAEERVGLLDDMGKRLEQAVQTVDGLMKSSETAAKAMERAIEMESLAFKQQALAAGRLEAENRPTPSGAADPETKKRTDEWRKEQDKVADALARLTKEMAPSAAGRNAVELKMAGRIAEAARQLGDEQSKLAEAAQKIPELQQLDKRLGELAERQAALSDLAKSDTLTEHAVPAMLKAAERIFNDRLSEAIPHQTEAVKSMSQAVERMSKDAAGDPWSRGATPRETLDALSEKARQAAEKAAASAEKASVSEKATRGESDKFEGRAKAAGKPGDPARAAVIEEQKAILKSLAQKAKEEVAHSAQAAREARQFADETAAAAKRLAPNASVDDSGSLVSQAERKARDADQKALRAAQSAEMAELASSMAAEFNKKDIGVQDYNVEPKSHAAESASKASESAAAAAELIKRAEKSVEGTVRSRDELRKARQTAERNAQPDLVKELGARERAAQREEAAARQALDGIRRAADQARQAAEQAKRASEASADGQNRRASADQAHESMRKSLEAAHQALLAKDIHGEAVAAERAARKELVDELALSQNSIKDKAEELLKAKRDILDAHVRSQVAELEKRQSVLADEAKAIAALAAREAAPSDKSGGNAADAAEKAKDALREGDLGSAKKSAGEAAQALSHLAARLASALASRLDTAKGDPGRDGSPLSSTSRLARRADTAAQAQEAVRRELESLTGGKPIEHLAARQETIERQVEELRKDAEAFQIQARELNLPQRSQQVAAEGERGLQAARQQAERAAKVVGRMDEDSRQTKENPRRQLQGHLTNEARQAQAASGQALGQAADKMKEAQAAIDDALKNPPTALAPELETDLPVAYGLAREAAIGQRAIPALQAAEALNAAATKAAVAAKASGVNTTPAKVSAVTPGDRNDNASTRQAPPGFDGIARRFGIKFEDWLRLPGSLRGEMLQSAASEGPEEYRELIKRYFEELAKKGMEGK